MRIREILLILDYLPVLRVSWINFFNVKKCLDVTNIFSTKNLF